MISSELPRPHTSRHWEEEPWKWVITGQRKQSKDRAVVALRGDPAPWVRMDAMISHCDFYMHFFLTSNEGKKTVSHPFGLWDVCFAELTVHFSCQYLSISACFFLADFGELCHRYREYLLSFSGSPTPGCTLTLLARKYRQGTGLGAVTEDSRWVETHVFEEN